MDTPAVQPKVKIVPQGYQNLLVKTIENRVTRTVAEIKGHRFSNTSPVLDHLEWLEKFVSKTVRNYTRIKTSGRVPEVWVNEGGEFSVRFGVRGMAFEVYSLNLDNEARANFGLPPLSDEARRGDNTHSI